MLVGGGHKERQRSKVDGEEWRKGVVDVEVARVSPAVMAARCSGGWGARGRGRSYWEASTG
jgi:hypothetical protein